MTTIPKQDAQHRVSRRPRCTHPPVARELHNGYDVTCGDCEAVVGRVARFGRETVLSHDEAKELLGILAAAGEGSSVRAKLEKVAR